MQPRPRPQIDESYVDESGLPASPGSGDQKYRKFTAGPDPESSNQFDSFIPPNPRPPEGYEDFMSPDYSNRDKFSEHVFQTIGGNPFDIDLGEELAKADQELPELFEYVFRGQAIWQDRHLLNNQQRAYWEDAVKAYHAHVKEQVESKKQTMTDRYNQMMNMFDNSAQQYKANLTRYRAYNEKAVAHQRSLELAKAKKKDEKGGPSREDLIAASKYEKEVMSNYGPGQQISAMDLRSINRVRKAVGLPEVKESMTPGTKKENPGLGAFDEVQPDQYSYYEEGSEPKPEKGKEKEEPKKPKPQRKPGTAYAKDSKKRWFRNKETGKIQSIDDNDIR
jgi:hypothetical protein